MCISHHPEFISESDIQCGEILKQVQADGINIYRDKVRNRTEM